MSVNSNAQTEMLEDDSFFRRRKAVETILGKEYLARATRADGSIDTVVASKLLREKIQQEHINMAISELEFKQRVAEAQQKFEEAVARVQESNKVSDVATLEEFAAIVAHELKALGKDLSDNEAFLPWQKAAGQAILTAVEKRQRLVLEAARTGPTCVGACGVIKQNNLPPWTGQNKCSKGKCVCTPEDRLFAAFQGTGGRLETEKQGEAGDCDMLRRLLIKAGCGAGKSLVGSLLCILFPWTFANKEFPVDIEKANGESDADFAMRERQIRTCLQAKAAMLCLFTEKNNLTSFSDEGLFGMYYKQGKHVVRYTDDEMREKLTYCGLHTLAGISIERLLQLNKRVVNLDFVRTDSEEYDKAWIVLGMVQTVGRLGEVQRHGVRNGKTNGAGKPSFKPNTRRITLGDAMRFKLIVLDEGDKGSEVSNDMSEGKGQGWANIQYMMKRSYVVMLTATDSQWFRDRGIKPILRCAWGELLKHKRSCSLKVRYLDYAGLKINGHEIGDGDHLTPQEMITLRENPVVLGAYFKQMMRDMYGWEEVNKLPGCSIVFVPAEIENIRDTFERASKQMHASPFKGRKPVIEWAACGNPLSEEALERLMTFKCDVLVVQFMANRGFSCDFLNHGLNLVPYHGKMASAEARYRQTNGRVKRPIKDNAKTRRRLSNYADCMAGCDLCRRLAEGETDLWDEEGNEHTEVCMECEVDREQMKQDLHEALIQYVYENPEAPSNERVIRLQSATMYETRVNMPGNFKQFKSMVKDEKAEDYHSKSSRPEFVSALQDLSLLTAGDAQARVLLVGAPIGEDSEGEEEEDSEEEYSEEEDSDGEMDVDMPHNEKPEKISKQKEARDKRASRRGGKGAKPSDIHSDLSDHESSDHESSGDESPKPKPKPPKKPAGPTGKKRGKVDRSAAQKAAAEKKAAARLKAAAEIADAQVAAGQLDITKAIENLKEAQLRQEQMKKAAEAAAEKAEETAERTVKWTDEARLSQQAVLNTASIGDPKLARRLRFSLSETVPGMVVQIVTSTMEDDEDGEEESWEAGDEIRPAKAGKGYEWDVAPGHDWEGVAAPKRIAAIIFDKSGRPAPNSQTGKFLSENIEGLMMHNPLTVMTPEQLDSEWTKLDVSERAVRVRDGVESGRAAAAKAAHKMKQQPMDVADDSDDPDVDPDPEPVVPGPKSKPKRERSVPVAVLCKKVAYKAMVYKDRRVVFAPMLHQLAADAGMIPRKGEYTSLVDGILEWYAASFHEAHKLLTEAIKDPAKDAALMTALNVPQQNVAVKWFDHGGEQHVREIDVFDRDAEFTILSLCSDAHAKLVELFAVMCNPEVTPSTKATPGDTFGGAGFAVKTTGGNELTYECLGEEEVREPKRRKKSDNTRYDGDIDATVWDDSVVEAFTWLRDLLLEALRQLPVNENLPPNTRGIDLCTFTTASDKSQQIAKIEKILGGVAHEHGGWSPINQIGMLPRELKDLARGQKVWGKVADILWEALWPKNDAGEAKWNTMCDYAYSFKWASHALAAQKGILNIGVNGDISESIYNLQDMAAGKQKEIRAEALRIASCLDPSDAVYHSDSSATDENWKAFMAKKHPEMWAEIYPQAGEGEQ